MGQMCQKKIRQEKNFNYVKIICYLQRFLNCVKMTRHSQRIQGAKCFSTSKLNTLKALLNKNWFNFFFLILWHAKILLSFKMPPYWLNSSLVFFLKFFLFFKFNMLDKKAALIRLKIKTICLTKKLF